MTRSSQNSAPECRKLTLVKLRRQGIGEIVVGASRVPPWGQPIENCTKPDGEMDAAPRMLTTRALCSLARAKIGQRKTQRLLFMAG